MDTAKMDWWLDVARKETDNARQFLYSAEYADMGMDFRTANAKSCAVSFRKALKNAADASKGN